MTGGLSTAIAARFTVRAVLFDLDGTLADTAPDLGGALNRMRARRGLDALPIELLRPVASSGARGMLAAGLQVTPETPGYEALREEFLAEYESALDRDSVLFEGVAACLAGLRTQGLRWAVVTNKATRFTGPVLAGLGLSVEVVVCGDTTPHAKPHPAPLLEACARLGVRASEAIYVGDDLRDIQAARAAGMPGVVAGYGYLGERADLSAWGADAVIAAPLDLLALLAAVA
jgi:2-phosphoglycolate phosphatase